MALQVLRGKANNMKLTNKFLAVAVAISALLGPARSATADVVITTFDDNYFEDALYANWLTANIQYGPDSYSITATGYGSNWTYIGEPRIEGAGNTHLKLDVTLAGPPAADGHLGPIITLVDADGTRANYAWFGQLLGNHILTLPLATPSWYEAQGTTPGLDLTLIDHMHLQLDPGGFGTSGAYTVSWNELSLITETGTPGDFDDDGDVDGRDFLIWQRGATPTLANLQDWQTNYGTTGPLAAVSSVPEPATVTLLVFAISAISLVRPSHLMA
jgi:hypothetical protein